MKKTFLFFILALCSIALFAQNVDWFWAKQAGGTNDDDGCGIAVDDNGNSYVTGFFKESATFSTTTLTSRGDYDIFVAKMDSNGNWLWAKHAGEQVMMVVRALLLITMEIAMLQVILKEVQPSALQH